MDSVSGASSYVPPPTSATTTTDTMLAQLRSDIKQNSQDFKALKTALNANDLAGATQAFATVSQDIQNASTAAGGTNPFAPSGPIGKDFQAIGTALKSGDLTAAKQAFAAFKTDIKIAGRAARAQNAGATTAANDGDADDGASGAGPTAAAPASPASPIGSILNASA